MLKCPNCGLTAEITKDWACRWCDYPLISIFYALERTKREAKEAERARKEAGKAEKRAEKEARNLAKEKVKREAEEARKTRKEAERAEKEARKLAKEKAKREVEEDGKTGEEAEKAEKEARNMAKEKLKREVEEDGKTGEEAETYEEEVKLVLPSLVSFERLKQFEKHIERDKNLKIVWTAGSENEGEIIAVLLQKPLNLIAILNEMPMVQEVHKKGETIVVMLKTPIGNSEDY